MILLNFRRKLQYNMFLLTTGIVNGRVYSFIFIFLAWGWYLGEFIDSLGVDFLLKSPLLIGVAYSLWGVFMGTYPESSMVS